MQIISTLLSLAQKSFFFNPANKIERQKCEFERTFGFRISLEFFKSIDTEVY